MSKISGMTYEETMETGRLVRLPDWHEYLAVQLNLNGLNLFSEGRYAGYIGGVSAKERDRDDWELWFEIPVTR